MLMLSMLDLETIERKAYRSTYEDGLWDMYMGTIVAAMAIFVYRPPGGYSPINIILMVVVITLSLVLFTAGKKYITQPRMGQVRFGQLRQQKKRTLAIIMGVLVLFQAGLVGLTALGWFNPGFGARLFGSLGGYSQELLLVASLGSLFVGLPMLVIAYYNDFPRGYYIAIMMALAVFLMILTNQPIYPLVIGGLIFLPGLVLFIRFLRKYPLPRSEEANG
jgi:hypothetical protein